MEWQSGSPALARPGTGTVSPTLAWPDFIVSRRCAAAYARCCPRLLTRSILRFWATTPITPVPICTRPPVA